MLDFGLLLQSLQQEQRPGFPEDFDGPRGLLQPGPMGGKLPMFARPDMAPFADEDGDKPPLPLAGSQAGRVGAFSGEPPAAYTSLSSSAPPDGKTAAPAAGTPAQPAVKPEPSLFDGIGDHLRKLNDDPAFWSKLGAFGFGLAGGRTWGEGISAGGQAAMRQAQVDALTGDKRSKEAQAKAAQNMTLQWMIGKGVPQADAQAAIAASIAGNRELLQSHFNNLVPKAEAGYRLTPDGSMIPIPGGDKDPATIQARAKAQAAGTSAGTPDEPEWVMQDMPGPNGISQKMWVQKGKGLDKAVPLGGPQGADAVDPGKLAEERAKEQAKLEAGALKKGEVAQVMGPVLQRALDAYEKLHAANAIGPVVGSGIGRTAGALLHSPNEALKQEFEAASKDLELYQAQAKMKGQGAITESERRLLALTLPRLDAVDGATGLKTLRMMQDETKRSIAGAQASPLATPSTGIRPSAPEPQAAAPAPAPAPQTAPKMPSRAEAEAELRRRGVIR